MPNPQLPPWVTPAAALSGVLLSAGCAWWQVRRDKREFQRTGSIPFRDVSWLELIIFLVAIIGPLAALKTMNDHRQGFVPLSLCLAALGSQAFLLPRTRGRIEMKILLCLSLLLGTFVLLHLLRSPSR